MKQASDEERQAIWETLLSYSNRGRLDHGDITWIADQLHFGRKAVSRIWHQGLESMGPRQAATVKSRASAQRRKRVGRRDLCQRVSEVPIGDRKNQVTLQLATNTSCYLIQQLIKEGYLRAR
ncbi:unnamed protein product [Phytophthora lilii]|uniref:Unnamed protein product n=1 Tax=Phytophthora lilii TaxID=2077276 RepID=A0A9W6X2M6_9STRA|nr:unnamed protein product [Phytophthora lilii]